LAAIPRIGRKPEKKRSVQKQLQKQQEHAAGMEGVRINKYLSGMGICSRREADRLLEEGRIRVNGKPAVPGQRIMDADVIKLDGKTVTADLKGEPVLLAFHKPRGIICSTTSNDRGVNIIDYINYPTRIFPVGRLDKDSEGIILLTNRGELVNGINKARYGHEKEYIVTCRKPVTDSFLKQMQDGVEILLPVIDASEADRSRAEGREFIPVTTRPCKVRRIDDFSFDIILTQGLNRQIRRMCDALGNYVERLQRIRVMNIELGNLPAGEWREVTGQELRELENTLARNADEN